VGFGLLGTLPWWFYESPQFDDFTPISLPDNTSVAHPTQSVAAMSRTDRRTRSPIPTRPIVEDTPVTQPDTELEPESKLPRDIMVFVRVATTQGDHIPGAHVYVQCESTRRFKRADFNGRTSFIRLPSERCTLNAGRRDGFLWARSKSVTIDFERGDYELELTLPHKRTGGIGVTFASHEEGVIVHEVQGNTPAARAGLESGDYIVEVDGITVASLTESEFIAKMTGEEGSQVIFTVAYESESGWAEEDHEVTRAFLGP
jgi:membrane-associated protease RseP (regulator of RpoE activity)